MTNVYTEMARDLGVTEEEAKRFAWASVYSGSAFRSPLETRARRQLLSSNMIVVQPREDERGNVEDNDAVFGMVFKTHHPKSLK